MPTTANTDTTAAASTATATSTSVNNTYTAIVASAFVATNATVFAGAVAAVGRWCLMAATTITARTTAQGAVVVALMSIVCPHVLSLLLFVVLSL